MFQFAVRLQMNRPLVVIAILFCGGIGALAESRSVPVPQFTGPIPVTADSFPFLTASRNLAPMDLSQRGFVEEEFVVSGNANVYDWLPDGSLTVKTPNVHYATRILVRHPTNPSKFSGTVVIELMSYARRFDWGMMWGYLHEEILERGDAWVGITMPGSIDGLKKFNPGRYAALSFGNPTPEETCIAGNGRGRGQNSTSAQEEGLRWDMISQISALFKSSAPNRPMAKFEVASVFMTNQGAEIATYISAIHPNVTLENGQPVYDGYVAKNLDPPGRLRRCGEAPAKGDPRQLVKAINVPVVAVVAQGDVLASLPNRRPDSDDPNGRFRLYEIAAGSHANKSPYDTMPSFAEENAAGGAQGTPAWPFNETCDTPVPFISHPLMSDTFHAALHNLELWVRMGVPPPSASRVEVKDGAVVLDEFGHAVGGVRSPWVDVPVATYYVTSAGPGTCRELYHKVVFEPAKLVSLYGSQKNYLSRANQDVDKLVKERYFTETDGKTIKQELAKSVPEFSSGDEK